MYSTELKIIILKNRLQNLEGRTSDCGKIKAKLERQIRNLESK